MTAPAATPAAACPVCGAPLPRAGAPWCPTCCEVLNDKALPRVRYRDDARGWRHGRMVGQHQDGTIDILICRRVRTVRPDRVRSVRAAA